MEVVQKIAKTVYPCPGSVSAHAEGSKDNPVPDDMMSAEAS
jgi:hypothetical protein